VCGGESVRVSEGMVTAAGYIVSADLLATRLSGIVEEQLEMNCECKSSDGTLWIDRSVVDHFYDEWEGIFNRYFEPES